MTETQCEQTTSQREGGESVEVFCQARAGKVLRRATRDEDMNEHWDVLDAEFGRVDVKSAKRFKRGEGIDFTAWWEIKTVKRPPFYKSQNGWGMGNGIRRFIALRLEEGFYLMSPEEVAEDLRLMNQRAALPKGRGEFCLHTREGRDDLTTILPETYVRKNARHFVRVWL